MRIQVNGKEHMTDAGTTVDKLLEELGFYGRMVAVAVNHQCILRREYTAKALGERDVVEILAPMAGG